MENYKMPTNNLEAFTLALRMAVEAPNDELSNKATVMAEMLATRLTTEQVNKVKATLEAEAA
tara:strand:- start:583 stop:768 length:186 start_codon:yes stop_codon:yes gene_type:complete